MIQAQKPSPTIASRMLELAVNWRFFGGNENRRRDGFRQLRESVSSLSRIGGISTLPVAADLAGIGGIGGNWRKPLLSEIAQQAMADRGEPCAMARAAALRAKMKEEVLA
jgi:hypothetical protein